jgi:hypothetical protein
MCAEKKRYCQVLGLFGPTHPPILLRMHSAAKEFGNKLGIEKDVNKVFPVPSSDLTRAIFWYNLIDGLTNVPLKLAMPECLRLSDQVRDDGQLIQIVPDLAGFTKGKGSKTFPGYPANEDTYFAECYPSSPQRRKKN